MYQTELLFYCWKSNLQLFFTFGNLIFSWVVWNLLSLRLQSAYLIFHCYWWWHDFGCCDVFIKFVSRASANCLAYSCHHVFLNPFYQLLRSRMWTLICIWAAEHSVVSFLLASTYFWLLLPEIYILFLCVFSSTLRCEIVVYVILVCLTG